MPLALSRAARRGCARGRKRCMETEGHARGRSAQPSTWIALRCRLFLCAALSELVGNAQHSGGQRSMSTVMISLSRTLACPLCARARSRSLRFIFIQGAHDPAPALAGVQRSALKCAALSTLVGSAQHSGGQRSALPVCSAQRLRCATLSSRHPVSMATSAAWREMGNQSECKITHMSLHTRGLLLKALLSRGADQAG
eukprot:TRINITY_DN5536_c0_g1_i1.p1 TRINITY_DN5536_c0_g1~~TRINITY_DN5536_c0_g1_i1.p1  ORF type:complete len:198 (+),score=9.23 TRINITY_DN5536_c0_g1_i1:148-741(+)